jgi:hypothetical protein
MRTTAMLGVFGSLTVGAIALTTLATAPACSSGGGCSAASKCSADPKPTTDTINTCNALSADACGSQYTDLNSCEQSQQVCAADNTTDITATTNGFETNCKTQIDNYSTCCAANLAACKGTSADGG